MFILIFPREWRKCWFFAKKHWPHSAGPLFRDHTTGWGQRASGRANLDLRGPGGGTHPNSAAKTSGTDACGWPAPSHLPAGQFDIWHPLSLRKQNPAITHCHNSSLLFLLLSGKERPLFFFFLINFYWRIVTLQPCISFCCTTKWISYVFLCNPSLLDFLPI